MYAKSINPYLVLGLTKNSSIQLVERQYKSLLERLDETRFMHSPQAWVQAGQARLEIENNYLLICSGKLADEEDSEIEPFWPKLGQILVKAGKISIEQLQDALVCQKEKHYPLGEILRQKGLLSLDELGAFLSCQNFITLPEDSPYLLGLRLIALGIVPEDMVCIALLEYCDSRISLEKILVERGWLSREIFDALML